MKKIKTRGMDQGLDVAKKNIGQNNGMKKTEKNVVDDPLAGAEKLNEKWGKSDEGFGNVPTNFIVC